REVLVPKLPGARGTSRLDANNFFFDGDLERTQTVFFANRCEQTFTFVSAQSAIALVEVSRSLEDDKGTDLKVIAQCLDGPVDDLADEIELTIDGGGLDALS